MTRSAEVDSRFRGNDGWVVLAVGMNQDSFGTGRSLLKEHD